MILAKKEIKSSENRKIKSQNQRVASLFAEIFFDIKMSENTLKRIGSCADFMEFLRGFEIFENEKKEKKVMTQALFCENRFCPICGKNKARKDAVKLGAIMDCLKKEFSQAFLFLTLTVPNCKADELSRTITEMNKAFQRLVKRYAFKRLSNGFMRKLEVTFNRKRDDFHPHFHVLISVDRSYFKNPKQYLNHFDWLKLWQEAMRDSSIKMVNVKKAKDDVVLEMSKYMAKDSDFAFSAEVLKAFYENLKGRQLITFSGLFAEMNKAFDEGELEEFELGSIVYLIELVSTEWNKNNYDERTIQLGDLPNEKINLINLRLEKKRMKIERRAGGKFELVKI